THSRFTALFDAFTRETGIAVTHRFVPTEDILPFLLRAAESRQLPDAVVLSADNLSVSLLAYEDVPRDLVSDAIDDAILDLARVDGRLKGIPILTGNQLLLYYNKTRLPHAPARLEALAPASDDAAPRVAWNFRSMYWFLTFLAGRGGFPIRDGDVALDTPPMRETLEAYVALARSGFVDPDLDYPAIHQAFVDGRLDAIIDGEWVAGELHTAMGETLGIAPLPTWEGTPLQAFRSAQVLAFPNLSLSGRRGPLLRQLARFLQTPEAQRYIWQTIGAIPVRRDTQAELRASGDHHMAALLETWAAADALRPDRRMPLVWEALKVGFTRCAEGIYTAADAAAFMQHRFAQSSPSQAPLPPDR
ncbi:MAG: extracellular solute-binding protein, partial [Verrucomicrobia bacterium]